MLKNFDFDLITFKKFLKYTRKKFEKFLKI